MGWGMGDGVIVKSFGVSYWGDVGLSQNGPKKWSKNGQKMAKK